MIVNAGLRPLLDSDQAVLVPGVYDGLSALLAERTGFECAYISGASIAYTRFGRPDIGLVSFAEVANVLSDIRERVSIPLIVDGDTGFGNALNVMRTVRQFERLGADAVQIEDQVMPKRCGHLSDKAVVPVGEMVGKIKAATDARSSGRLLIIARTDALAIEGVDAAIERAFHYVEAGADVLFVEAPHSRAHLEAIAGQLKANAPLVVNMVEGGRTPLCPPHTLDALGFSLILFPGSLVRAFAYLASGFLRSLREHGSTEPYRDCMVDFAELNTILDTESLLAAGRRYETKD